MASVQAHNFSPMGVYSVKSTVTVLEGDFTEEGVVSTERDAFLLEDTTLCGGGVRFDLEEGSSSSGVGIILCWMKDEF